MLYPVIHEKLAGHDNIFIKAYMSLELSTFYSSINIIKM
jgi:hypothetical protein